MVMTRQGIAILGGSFDPIHQRHLSIAQWMINHLPYRQIHLIPCYQHALHKRPIASAQQRLIMIQKAIQSYPSLVANDCEIKRGGLSYTIDTLQQLQTTYPNDPLLCTMGADVFLTLEQWHHWTQILARSQLLVVPRPGIENSALISMATRLALPLLKPHQYTIQKAGTLIIADCDPIDIASTHIRNQLSQNSKPIALPPVVLDYIQKQALYR